MPANLFFSYSHEDESYRDKLEKHLSLLRHQGLLESWHDRRITTGSEVDASIDEALDAADVVLLLVSASFVASSYCYSREMMRAMERHEAKRAVVIPVIVRPCDWHSAPFGKLLAVPTDGKAITQWPNEDEAYTNVARHVRKVVEQFGRVRVATAIASKASTDAPEPAARAAPPRSSNLRLKKAFTDLDADTFLNEAFEYMARFFEGSLDELAARSPGVDARFQRIDASTFTAAVYKQGKKQSECAIHFGGSRGFAAGILYSSDASARGNSFNERLSVEADDQSMFLRPLGMATFSGGDKDKLSPEGASELYWSLLMRNLQ
jgi:hypothetical protein